MWLIISSLKVKIKICIGYYLLMVVKKMINVELGFRGDNVTV